MRMRPQCADDLTVNLFGRSWECRHLVTDQLSEANTLRWQELVHRESDRDVIHETAAGSLASCEMIVKQPICGKESFRKLLNC